MNPVPRLSMSALHIHYPPTLPDFFTLPREEHELLEEALLLWQDPVRFSDEKVVQVKDIFRNVFGLSREVLLAGSSLPDSIILQGSNNTKAFYAVIQLTPPRIGWKAYVLRFDNDFVWPRNVPLRSILNQFQSQSDVQG